MPSHSGARWGWPHSNRQERIARVSSVAGWLQLDAMSKHGRHRETAGVGVWRVIGSISSFRDTDSSDHEICSHIWKGHLDPLRVHPGRPLPPRSARKKTQSSCWNLE